MPAARSAATPAPPQDGLVARSAAKGAVGALGGALVAATLALVPTAASAATSYDVIATVDVGRGVSDGLAVDPAHDAVYVVNAAHDSLTVIDTTTNEVEATIAVGDEPFRVAVDPAIDRAYVSNYLSSSVSVIDTTTHTVLRTITGFNNPRDLAVDPSTHLLYVTNYMGNQDLVVVDPTTPGAPLTRTPILESRPWAVDVDPTTHRAYATTLFGGTLSTVEGTTIVDTLYLHNGPTQVMVDPATKQAYVARNGQITVVDISADAAVATGTLPAGTGASDVVLDPATGLLYVSNHAAGTVSVVDQATNTLLDTVTVGTSPNAIGIDPVTQRVYVLNGGDRTVSVIDSFESQEIAFTSDVPPDAAVGGSHTVTATGGASGEPVTFSTESAACTVTGAGEVSFAHAGECVVSADQAGDDEHTAAPTVTQEIPVAKGAQAITFTSVPPTDATIGGTYPVTASGGGSGEPVTLAVHPSTTNAACTLADGVVSFERAGTCVVAAHQGGTSDWDAAPTATQAIAVDLIGTTTSVTLPAGSVVHGQSATAKATVTGTAGGSVRFTVDGGPVGDAVPLGPDGTATSADLIGSGLAVGAHHVGAVFTPAEVERYDGSAATPATLTVDQAATTSTVSVGPGALAATVTPVAPGAGVPTGTVRFHVGGTEIGSATLSNGVATLAHAVPTGSTREVSAVYAGDASFTGSSASTARRDPVITATVTSRKAPRRGWYATPVTVTFTCEATSAPLSESCPEPVRLSRSEAAQSVTRTVLAADGGAATAVVDGIDVDRVRPSVRIRGVRAGATYFATGPRARCRATDRLSGVAACKVRRTTRGTRVVYVATATDRAGNRSRTRLVAHTTSVTVSGAPRRGGHYVVRLGRTYTVLVAAAQRPTYVFASPAPRRPAGEGPAFKRVGKHRWALGVTFTRSMRERSLWNIGTRVGGRTTVTTVRVVR